MQDVGRLCQLKAELQLKSVMAIVVGHHMAHRADMAPAVLVVGAQIVDGPAHRSVRGLGRRAAERWAWFSSGHNAGVDVGLCACGGVNSLALADRGRNDFETVARARQESMVL